MDSQPQEPLGPATPVGGHSTDQLLNKKLGQRAAVEAPSPVPEAECPSKTKFSRKKIWIILGFVLLLLGITGAVIGALVGTGVIKVGHSSSSVIATETPEGTSSEGGHSRDDGASDDTNIKDDNDTDGNNSSEDGEQLECTAAKDIPTNAKGTFLDPTSWYEIKDFNCTFTDETIGDLPLVGLFVDWDDSARANPNVPPLNEPWGSYGEKPIHGVNLGGWFSLEPFITPSIFEFSESDGVVDEYTLCKHLGPIDAAKKLEKHYATYIGEKDFKEIADAGLDHVRIPFGYWAVAVYDDDPFVFRISWRYLLRAIEWARKYGLRVKLDLHAGPGSQNGWNHSGKEGDINWLSGTNGTQNAERTADIHDKLSKFFSQPRYKNVVAFYGLLNEPSYLLDQSDIAEWTAQVYEIVHDNGMEARQVFSDSMKGLDAWSGQLTGYNESLVIDTHQYTIFSGLVSLTHAEKIEFACASMMNQVSTSMGRNGFGPTMVGEWSQADTDCVPQLNGVGSGARWDGTFEKTSPMCPTADERCNCDKANESPENYSEEYKKFLLIFAIAQMDAFETGWGWFYWTWKAETAAQWSYKHGLDNGYMPEKAYSRDRKSVV